MGNYLLRRLFLMIPTLIGMTIVVFVIIRAAPGRPEELLARGESGEVQLGETARDRNLELMRERMGLTGPWYAQYGRWMSNVVRLDFGDSLIHNRPVMEMIRERLPVTITLNALATILIYFTSIPIGLMAARNRERGGMRQITGDTLPGFLLLAMYSFPSIFAGTLVLVLMGAGGQLNQYIQTISDSNPTLAAFLSFFVFPIRGFGREGAEQLSLLRYLFDMVWHLALPVFTMALGALAFMSKQARTSLLENLRMDYVRTARAKGLRERTVVYVHALRNSLLPMLTLMTGILPSLIGGSIIIEQIFNLPGMGLLMWDAVRSRDYTIIQGVSLVGASLTLVAILITDVLYAVVDPRIKYD
jgi:peptide/nickel transport system permease protein